jgi:hypothetical protein
MLKIIEIWSNLRGKYRKLGLTRGVFGLLSLGYTRTWMYRNKKVQNRYRYIEVLLYKLKRQTLLSLGSL